MFLHLSSSRLQTTTEEEFFSGKRCDVCIYESKKPRARAQKSGGRICLRETPVNFAILFVVWWNQTQLIMLVDESLTSYWRVIVPRLNS